MNNEQFKRANEISDRLSQLVSEKEQVESRLQLIKDGKYKENTFSIRINHNYVDGWSLISGVSYISPVILMESYLAGINKKIEELENEFAEL